MAVNMYLALVSVALLCATVAAKQIPNNVSVKKIDDITFVKDINNFAKSHPGMKIIPMIKEESKGRSQSVRYTMGQRIDGDYLVAQGTDTFTYATPNDVSLQLKYPESGKGSIITHVEIVAIQNNNSGNAYVVDGGIGQRFIALVIEAQETDYFQYKASYFGTN